MAKATAKDLDKEEALSILSPGGPLSTTLKGYEPRTQQLAMMGKIIEAYNRSEIALIEAGTGTGKSLAYLIPAILWNRQTGERTVISTNTINLQEQLIQKDIPLIAKALNIDFKAVLVKGMGNYVCLRKLAESKMELPLMTPQEKQEMDVIEAWSETTREGSRSTLPIVPSLATWEKVNAEHDTCNHNECPCFKDCFYYKARRQASDANILVVNHHLLFSDLITRNEEKALEDTALLPPYTRVIIDEAHNIEEIATDFFASRMNQLGFLRTLSRLAAEKQGKPSGKLPLLKRLLLEGFRNERTPEVSSLFNRLDTDLPAMRWDVWHWTNRTCQAFEQLANQLSGQKTADEQSPGDVQLRLLSMHQTHPLWEREIVLNAKQFIGATEKYIQALTALLLDVSTLKSDRMGDTLKSTLFEINALANRLNEGCDLMRAFIQPGIPTEKVRWVDVQAQRASPSTSLYDANLDVAKDLARYLFNRFPTTVLVSATLTSNQEFDFMRKRLGLVPELLENRIVTEEIYDSPFDYKQQALLAIPKTILSPQDPNFLQEAVEYIWKTLQASRGNAFILFTSYSMLKTCYDLLAPRLKEQRYHPLKQGDTNRQALIKMFKETDRSVLFGTDSFWEGVDVVGEALRCVIIVKLPFKVPTEPMMQARTEAIQARGGDPFNEYSLPMAVVKFKQGFGRLIRNRRDRGCVVCLDSRLLTRGYGKLFLNSLPPCQQLLLGKEEFQEKLEAFYRSTYHLVSK